MSVRKGGQIIAGAEETKFVSSHTIGEIFWTSRLTPQISGAVDADGKIYPVASFTGKESVPALLSKGELNYVSFAEYESIVSANGSCRAWGWDGGDTFRVPTAGKMKRVLVAKKEATATDSTWYNLYSDGWLEQGGQATGTPTFTISFLKPFRDANYTITTTTKTGNTDVTVRTMEPILGKILASSCTLQSCPSFDGTQFFWQACGYAEIPTEAEYQFQNIETHRAMIQISTGVKEDATQLKEYKFNNPHFFGQSMYSDVDPKNSSLLISNGEYHSGRTYAGYYQWLVDHIGETITANGGKIVNSGGTYSDYDWVVNTADQTFRLPLLNGSEDLPSDRYENLTLQASGSPYTAPANGWYVLYKAATASGQYNESFSPSNRLRSMVHSSYSGGTSTYIFVKKGDVYEPYYSVAGVTQEFVFIYAQGNGSLYFYVGDTVQDASLINAGGVLSDVANLKQNKADVSALDAKLDREGNYTVVETYRNGSSWYRVWSDGWCEQGGYSAAGGYIVTFLKKYTSTDYTAFATFEGSYSANSISIVTRTNTGFHLNRGTEVTDIGGKFWRAEGYIR